MPSSLVRTSLAASLIALAAAPTIAHEAPRWYPSAPQSDSSVGFVMNKWGDPAGQQKTGVAGHFSRYEVAFSKPLATLRAPEDLAKLTTRVTVDLTSLETANPARNLNIAEHYFETRRFAAAVATFTTYKVLSRKGTQATLQAGGRLDLHGVVKPLDTVLDVTTEAKGLRVRSHEPITLTSADFGLATANLMKACGHLGIDPAATVSVDLRLGH